MRVTDDPANEAKGLPPIYQWEASSWFDLLDYAESRVKRGRFEESRDASADKQQWTGTRDWAQAMELARNGWPEGAAKIEPLAESLSVSLARMVQRDAWMYDLEGTEFDVGRMLSGEPEYWSHPEPTYFEESKQGTVVKILVNGCVSAYVTVETITQFGIAAGALIQTLSVAGIEADVQISYCVSDYQKERGSEIANRSRTVLPLKRAGEALDIHRLAFAVAHPSMFRRVIFSVWESHPRFDSEFSYGYGRVANDPYADRYDLTLEAQDYRGTTQEDAQRWVVEHAKALGVHFSEEAEQSLKAKAQGSVPPLPQYKPRRRYGRR